MKTFPIDGHGQLKDAGQISPSRSLLPEDSIRCRTRKKKNRRRILGGSWKRKEFEVDGWHSEGWSVWEEAEFRKMGESIHKNVFLSCFQDCGMKFAPDGGLVDLFGWRIPLSCGFFLPLHLAHSSSTRKGNRALKTSTTSISEMVSRF
ncbi:hypothetical protein HNY73_000838 [Argiope bruennichi]|uniref:Uncharacterized protein n=1 Tax=Argiope bruennichi TaxID=94029 RepID=A0A8T0G204_ARGBR|nr:hypothetical protein HNY73_000838 [Argiope bruennichi]